MISGIIVILASIFLLGAFDKVINAENEPKEKDSQIDHLHPLIIYPYSGDQYVSNVTTTFYADDIFAVNNPIKANILVYLKDTNIDMNFSIIQMSQDSDISWMNNDNLDPWFKMAKDNKNYISVETFLHPFINGTINYMPLSEGDQNIWIFWKPVGSHDKWLYDKFPMPKIYPVWNFQQVKTNRAIQNQIIETKRTNDITTGLTYVIVGFIPIGLVAEFWIEYLIENYFYRDERVKTVNKTAPWNCDWFPNE